MAASATAAPTTHYRSVGSAAPYSFGTVSVINGETEVVGAPGVKWQSTNRGLGDRITIAGVDYTIFSVEAENELTLTEPYGGATKTDETYAISRKFPRLNDWARCIQNQASCSDPGVFTNSLPADERIEIGVVYKDDIYFMNAGGEQLVLDSVVTSASYGITLTVNPANRHHGVADTGVVLNNTLHGNPAITISTQHVKIEWIEIHGGATTDQILVTGAGSNSQIVVRNVLFTDDDSTACGFHVNDDEANVLLVNNVLYGLDKGVHVNGLQVDSPGRFEIFHNTLFENAIGIHSNGTLDVENDVIFLQGNLSHSSTQFDFNAPNPNPSSVNNYSGDATATQHGGFGFISLGDVQFVSPTAPEDLHIRPTSALIDLGFVSAAVQDDLDGRLRDLPDIGADEAVSSSANPVKILTAKSTNGRVQLEWRQPDYGPMQRVEIIRSELSFPTKVADGSLACTVMAPAPFTNGRCSDMLPVVNGTTYYYSAFVYDFGSNYSKESSVTATPFDPSGTPPLWTYSTNAAALEPVGIRADTAFAISNDQFFHAMQGDGGATGGEWPLSGWAPYRLPTTAQHRPVIVDVLGAPTALFGAQDGRVYAVRIDTGLLLWRSEVLGTSINAAPAALVAAYGATGGGADKVYVGTSDLTSNALHVLDLNTGAWVTAFDDGGIPGNIGAVTGVAVKYPSGPVYFTSANGSAATPRNVWSLDVTVLPTTPLELWSDNPGEIDAGPTLYKGMLFVGSRTSELVGYNETGPSWLFKLPLGNGPVKAPIFPVYPHDTLVFTTNDEAHSVQFTATGGCASPPCLNWTNGVGGIASPILHVPWSNQLYVGVANGDLREIVVDPVVPTTLPVNRSWTLSGSIIGGPGFSLAQSMLYVGDSGGRIYGIPWPIP